MPGPRHCAGALDSAIGLRPMANGIVRPRRPDGVPEVATAEEVATLRL